MGIDSQKPDGLIVQLGPVPEPRLINENLLTHENVNTSYGQATLDAYLDPDKIRIRNPLVGDFEFFKPFGLELKNKIITFAYQLPEPLFIGNLGASVDYAYFSRNTKLSDIEKAFEKKKIPDFAWTQNEIVRNRLLSLIMAIDYGRVTTPSGKAGSKFHPNIPPRFWIFGDSSQKIQKS